MGATAVRTEAEHQRRRCMPMRPLGWGSDGTAMPSTNVSIAVHEGRTGGSARQTPFASASLLHSGLPRALEASRVWGSKRNFPLERVVDRGDDPCLVARQSAAEGEVVGGVVGAKHAVGRLCGLDHEAQLAEEIRHVGNRERTALFELC